jgi:hypothetical protein
VNFENSVKSALIVSNLAIRRDAQAITQIGVAHAIATTDVVHICRQRSRLHTSVIWRRIPPTVGHFLTRQSGLDIFNLVLDNFRRITHQFQTAAQDYFDSLKD